jgi:hypothetical protein
MPQSKYPYSPRLLSSKPILPIEEVSIPAGEILTFFNPPRSIGGYIWGCGWAYTQLLGIEAQYQAAITAASINYQFCVLQPAPFAHSICGQNLLDEQAAALKAFNDAVEALRNSYPNCGF